MNISIKRLLSPDIKIISTPIISILVVVIISFFIINPTYTKIQKSISDFKESTTTEKLLQDKLNSLKVVDTNILDKTDISFLALPDKNPSAWVVAQLKSGMNERSIIMKDIKLVKGKDKASKDLDKVIVTFNVVAPDLSSLVTFLNYINEITPLILIDDYTISEISDETGGIEVTLNMSVYFADLPAVLPPITEPFEGLSQKQEDILNFISKLNKPQFNTLDPLQPSERTTPFN